MYVSGLFHLARNGFSGRDGAPTFVRMNPADYARVAEAIRYIRAHAPQQPSLDEVAEAVHLSPFHFQRLFTDWAGVSPKKFLQYLTLGYAKSLLRQPEMSLFDTAHEAGLSGTGRLHHLFVSLEAMTPGSYRLGGRGLQVRYSTGTSVFGPYLVASTDEGIYALRFYDEDPAPALAELQAELPQAQFVQETDALHAAVASHLRGTDSGGETLRLRLRGTPFQIKVWEALLQVPEGAVATYTDIAHTIGMPTAQRAVGSAIGANPVGYLIPCHRVIRSTGVFGEYRWGSERKAAMLGWEAARNEK